jgi:hypothetical protein
MTFQLILLIALGPFLAVALPALPAVPQIPGFFGRSRRPQLTARARLIRTVPAQRGWAVPA